MGDKRHIFLNLRLGRDLRARLDAYLAAENARLAPANLTLTTVVNEAIGEYLDKRDGDSETEAA